MTMPVLLVSMCLVLFAAFSLGRSRAVSVAGKDGTRSLASLPYFYGMLTALWSALPGIALLGLWAIFQVDIMEYIVLQQLPNDILINDPMEKDLLLNQIYHLAYSDTPGMAPDFMLTAAASILDIERYSRILQSAMVLLIMAIGAGSIVLRISPSLRARQRVETIFKSVLLISSFLAVCTTIGIVLSVIFESLLFFKKIPISEFLFGSHWQPQSDFFGEETTEKSSFGILPLLFGTFFIAAIAMVVAIPVGLMSAIYLSEYASTSFRNIVKPLLETLAGIPTVVYGFFAALTVGPIVRQLAVFFGLDQWLTVSSESALAAGFVMGIMLIPFISSLSDDVIRAVPRSLRDASLGLGATPSETIKFVVLPAAMPGITSGILLAVSRAIGETMIVVMAAGLAAKITMNPLDSVTTVTTQIVALLVGDQEFDSPKTLAAFALGLVLFIITLILNYIALYTVKRYRADYE